MSTHNKVSKRVTAVLSDAHHTLHLIELLHEVRWVDEGTVNIDAESVEQEARKRATDVGIKGVNDFDTLDFVGVLVASDFAHTKGRIVWAKLIEVIEPVTI